MPKLYITDAIDYANGSPHLGHAYEKVITDCLARAHRQAGISTYFLLGTDEHGIKVQRAAEKAGLEPKAYVDKIVAEFQEAWRVLRVEPDQFIRTTDPRHLKAVHTLFERAYKAGDVYEHEYEGLYCQGCEAFYQEKDLVDGTCPIHLVALETVREKNFFFRLSKYAQPLLDHIAKNPTFIQPDMRRNEVVNVIKGGLDDISISRATVAWGVPMPPSIPNSAGQTIYVWFDALINYLTAIGFPDERYRAWWCGDDGKSPNALHVIGKDISRFHCIIWPAMLMSAGIPVARSAFVHGFIYARGVKLSKSLGNQIDPVATSARFGADALRWHLAREVAFGSDGDFTWERFIERYNVDLANDYGNLLSRSGSMLHKYRAGVVPARWEPTALEQEIEQLAATSAREVRAAWAKLQPSEALSAAWALVARANRYVEETKPWALAKDASQAQRLDTVLATLLEVGRLSTRWAWPVIPTKAEEAWRGLGLAQAPGPGDAGEKADAWFAGGKAPVNAGTSLPEVTILFPRIDADALSI
jgi:methionyl-tRNA synthetase